MDDTRFTRTEHELAPHKPVRVLGVKGSDKQARRNCIHAVLARARTRAVGRFHLALLAEGVCSTNRTRMFNGSTAACLSAACQRRKKNTLSLWNCTSDAMRIVCVTLPLAAHHLSVPCVWRARLLLQRVSAHHIRAFPNVTHTLRTTKQRHRPAPTTSETSTWKRCRTNSSHASCTVPNVRCGGRGAPRDASAASGTQCARVDRRETGMLSLAPCHDERASFLRKAPYATTLATAAHEAPKRSDRNVRRKAVPASLDNAASRVSRSPRSAAQSVHAHDP